jgi:hypothetical protein
MQELFCRNQILPLALSRKKIFISLSHPAIDFSARLEMGARSFF